MNLAWTWFLMLLLGLNIHFLGFWLFIFWFNRFWSRFAHRRFNVIVNLFGLINQLLYARILLLPFIICGKFFLNVFYPCFGSLNTIQWLLPLFWSNVFVLFILKLNEKLPMNSTQFFNPIINQIWNSNLILIRFSALKTYIKLV